MTVLPLSRLEASPHRGLGGAGLGLGRRRHHLPHTAAAEHPEARARRTYGTRGRSTTVLVTTATQSGRFTLGCESSLIGSPWLPTRSTTMRLERRRGPFLGRARALPPERRRGVAPGVLVRGDATRHVQPVHERRVHPRRAVVPAPGRTTVTHRPFLTTPCALSIALG